MWTPQWASQAGAQYVPEAPQPPTIQPCSVHQGPLLDSLQAHSGGLAACWSHWMGAPRGTLLGESPDEPGPHSPPLLPTPPHHCSVRLLGSCSPDTHPAPTPQPGQEGP